MVILVSFFAIAPSHTYIMRQDKQLFSKCKEDGYIGFSSENQRNRYKTLFYALVSIICEEKTFKTPNKLAGPVGKEGVLGGVYRLRNAGKTTKNITEPVTK